VNIAFFLLGDSPASEFSVLTFWNTLFDLKRSFNKKNNCDKIARVFIEVKVWLKRSLGQSEALGKGRGHVQVEEQAVKSKGPK
jgi:hypothetical protein